MQRFGKYMRRCPMMKIYALFQCLMGWKHMAISKEPWTGRFALRNCFCLDESHRLGVFRVLNLEGLNSGKKHSTFIIDHARIWWCFYLYNGCTFISFLFVFPLPCCLLYFCDHQNLDLWYLLTKHDNTSFFSLATTFSLKKTYDIKCFRFVKEERDLNLLKSSFLSCFMWSMNYKIHRWWARPFLLTHSYFSLLFEDFHMFIKKGFP